MPIVKPTAGGYEGVEVPDGLYVLTCNKVLDITLDKPDQYGKTKKFRLELEGATPDGEPFTVEPLMNQTFSNFPGKTPSTLFTYAEAFGCNPDANESFDTDDLVGRKLQAFIATDEEPGSWPRIQSISKVKGTRSTPSTPTPSPALPEGAPSILTADANVNWTAFWAATKRMGMTRESVAAQWNGDLGSLEKADPIEVAEWMQISWEAAQASPV